MTKDQKKILLIGAGVIGIVILLLLLKRPGSTVINNAGNVGDFGVDIPGLHIPARGGFTIPAIGQSPYIYEGRSACACDGRSIEPVSYKPAVVKQTVINRGNSGPNIYNYYTPAPAPPARYITT
jgi:hypothetical protein